MRVHILLVEQASHTRNDHQRRHAIRRQRGRSRQTRGHRNRMLTGRRRRDAGETALLQLHRSQQFVAVSGRNSLGARSSGTSHGGIGAQSGLLEASHVAKHVLVVVVLQAIGSAVRSQRHPVHMRLRRFDVVHLEREVGRLVNHQSEVAVVEVLSRNLRATGVVLDGDFGFLDDLDRVTNVGDFTKIVVVGDSFSHRRLTESKLNLLRIDNRGPVTSGKVAPTGSSSECHLSILLY